MGVNINVENAISDYKKNGGKTSFESSLKKIFDFASKDPKLNDVNHLAYLLATAKIEADFSLERWESDYSCKSKGVKYNNKPCQKALDYFCSTNGGRKKNYCTRKLDKKGLPYFGRGIIQLTWYDNYKKYGDLIGVDLANNPDLIFVPKNSYDVAVAYMQKKRGKSNKNTFDWVDEGNLARARKTVNGGEDKVKPEYLIWKKILNDNKSKAKTTTESKRSTTKVILGIGLGIITIGVTGTLIYLYLKKKNKLPNFMKKFIK